MISPMHCPTCRRALRVLDSRAGGESDGAVVRRRRKCLGCLRRYTSYEVLVDEHQVVMLIRRGAGKVIVERRVLAEENLWGGVPGARPTAPPSGAPRARRCAVCGLRGHDRRTCEVAA